MRRFSRTIPFLFLGCFCLLSLMAQRAQAIRYQAVLLGENYPGGPAFDDNLDLSRAALAANMATWNNWSRGPGGNIVELPGNTNAAGFKAAIDTFTAGGADPLNTGDFMMVFYFGHGGFKQGDEPAGSLDRQLVFADQSTFTDDQIANEFRAFNPGVLKVFVNISCYSGGFWGNVDPGGGDDLSTVPHTVLFASSSAFQPTYTSGLLPRTFEPFFLHNLIIDANRAGRPYLTLGQWYADCAVAGVGAGYRFGDPTQEPTDGSVWVNPVSGDGVSLLDSNNPADLNFTPIPEPGALTLLAVAGLIAWRTAARRRIA